ncbi:sugar phosphate isomerase/epimerase [Nonomuraea sp. KC401]|uniref:sugar phosphate isomerase/epimerase family protein n=1 Tax=unclassified Nonomuraea TaxID=2593643 RepID=UPI0010FF1FB8|nr:MULTISPECIES: sugar phosphate isomerase/epimerase [unclassified Nonomuraea]NBE93899.1 TIM barrel protein [Nonomuraea sp. K271]TLF62109.1 sugar phosphate isomerase/epimerase [Nonomuraea sp. KC401]
MRLGLLTACLPGESLEAIARWAGDHGYASLEVAAWPDRPGRDWEAAHLNVEAFGQADADRVTSMLDRHGLSISAVAYYENNLHADPAVREATHAHLRRCVDAARLLGVGLVGTFVGRDVTLTTAENLRLAERVLPPLVEYAAARDVRLVIENCPMEGWHPDGYPANLAYSPELWDWMAGLGLWLNYDPSHLVWLGIDPLAALEAHAERILHVQAKDVEVHATARDRYGVFGQVLGRRPWVSGWWRYRIPGLGEVDWRRLIDALHQHGYEGVVSVEHEDPVWSGDPGRVRKGLAIAHRTLAPHVHI